MWSNWFSSINGREGFGVERMLPFRIPEPTPTLDSWFPWLFEMFFSHHLLVSIGRLYTAGNIIQQVTSSQGQQNWNIDGLIVAAQGLRTTYIISILVDTFQCLRRTS